MHHARLFTSLVALAFFTLGCPGEMGTPDAGTNTVVEGPGLDAGQQTVDAGPPSRVTLSEDAGIGFVPGSAILFSTAGTQQVYAFADPQARTRICSGESTDLGDYLKVAVYADDIAPGSFDLASDADVAWYFADGGSIAAQTGSVTVTETTPLLSIAGSFVVMDLRDNSTGNLFSGGSATGTFDVTRCPSRPYFDGGSGPNSASGTFGFSVAGSVMESSGQGASVYLLAPDLSAEACAQVGNPSVDVKVAFLRVDFGSTAWAPGTFSSDAGTASGYYIHARSDGGDSYDQGQALDMQITVDETDGGFISGSYASTMLNQTGSIETLHGRFAAGACE